MCSVAHQSEFDFFRILVPAPTLLCPLVEELYSEDMSFPEAVRSSLRNWNNFRGRSSRSEFWWFQLFLVLAFFAYLIAIAVVYAIADADVSDTQANVIVGIWALAVLLPVLSLQIRRLRDAGLGWGFILLPVIPFLGSLALFVMFLLPSKPQLEPSRESGYAEDAASHPGGGDPAFSGPAADPTISQIERLSELHREGRINDDQFEAAKRKLLGA